MRIVVPLVLLLLPVAGLPARAQVINGETPYDEDMLPRQATASDGHVSEQRSPGQPARGEPMTVERPAPTVGRRE